MLPFVFLFSDVYFLWYINGLFTFMIFAQAQLIGAMFEGVLLSFALGYRINTFINKEKEFSRKQALESHKK